MSETLTPPFDATSELLIGSPAARAKLVWFVDFSCVHTRSIRDLIYRSVQRFTPEDVAVEVRVLPEHADRSAELAARAGVAAARQGKYLDMHRALFRRETDYSEETIRMAAEEAGVDIARLMEDLWSDDVSAKLAADRRSAEISQAIDTPVVFIGGRRYRGSWDEEAILEAIQRPLGVRLQLASHDFFRWAASSGLVLVVASIAALLMVNLGFEAEYHRLIQADFGITVAGVPFILPLEAWVNDAWMAIFFLVVGIEIKREVVDGELSSVASASLPILAAIGGMAVPALIFAAINFGLSSQHGWGVPMATDIAFTLGILAMLGSRVPTSLKVFVSALAIADDLGAIVAIALFYGHGFDTGAFLWAIVTFAGMLALNRVRVYAVAPYLMLGAVLWYFTYQSGLHATLAGVLTALAIPSRPSARLDDVAAQTNAILASTSPDGPASHETVEELEGAVLRLRDPGFHLQRWLENWSSYFILPIFAFCNTGIALGGADFSPLQPETMGVIAGLMLGKPIGIVLAVIVATRLGLGRLSAEITFLQLVGAGCLAGIGFTMSIFIASAAFEGDTLGAVKLATMIASIAAAGIGVAIMILADRIKPDIPDP